uniref:Arf-GAP domain-containing protein n=1 Tax=Odontella aurita TaxID=265563 RepID=A0A7S4JH73_9STRA|mmetsp:Transcript_46434/g.140615  ORF Transcript_46434/g.140615 Transcript_46434/m.140615 type:complete len:1802 (+) Transcript_46434:93-5498(+)
MRQRPSDGAPDGIAGQQRMDPLPTSPRRELQAQPQREVAQELSKKLRRQQSQSQPQPHPDISSPHPCLKVARGELNNMRRKHRQCASEALVASKIASSKKKRDDVLKSVTLPSRRSFPRDCLHVLRMMEGNARCVDCGAKEINGVNGRQGSPPMWASVPHGTILCKECAFMHITRSEKKKEYGSMSLVKHLENCLWNLPEIFSMLEGGNAKLLRHIVGQSKVLKKMYSKDGAPSTFFELDGLSDTTKRTFDSRYKGHAKALKKYRKLLAKSANNAATMFGIDDPHGPVDDNHEEVVEERERAEAQMLRLQEARATSPVREARPQSPTTPEPLREEFMLRPQDDGASRKKADPVEEAGATSSAPTKEAVHAAPEIVPLLRDGGVAGQTATSAVTGKGSDRFDHRMPTPVSTGPPFPIQTAVNASLRRAPSLREGATAGQTAAAANVGHGSERSSCQMSTMVSAAPPPPTQTAASANPRPDSSSRESATAGQTSSLADAGRRRNTSGRQTSTPVSAALPFPTEAPTHATPGPSPLSRDGVAVGEKVSAVTPQPQRERTTSVASIDASVASSVSMEQDFDSDDCSESGSIEGHPHSLQPLSLEVSNPQSWRWRAASSAGPASIADVDDISLCSASIGGQRISPSIPRRRRKVGRIGRVGRRPRSPSPSAKPFIPRSAAASRSYPVSTVPPSQPSTHPPPEDDDGSGNDDGSSDDDDFFDGGLTSMAALMQIASMKPSVIKRELETYGVSTEMFIEKGELVDALAQARADQRKIKSAKDPAASPDGKHAPSSLPSKTSPLSTSGTEKGVSSSFDGVDSGGDSYGKSREELIAWESQKINDMKASEIRAQLRERGISTMALFEKPEFVRALAEARADDEIWQQNEDAQEEKEQGGKSRRNRIPDDGISIETLPEIASMKLIAIKSELHGYGVSTQVFLEKSEICDALAQARDSHEKKEKKREPTAATSLPMGKPDSSSLPSKIASTSVAVSASDDSEARKRVRSSSDRGEEKGNDDGDSRSLEERIACESQKIKGMSASEIRAQLRERDILTNMMFEKPEFVRALAKARVDEEIRQRRQQELDHHKGPHQEKERGESEQQHEKYRDKYQRENKQGRDNHFEKPQRSSKQSKSGEEIQKQRCRELRQRAQAEKRREKKKHHRENEQGEDEHRKMPQRSIEQTKSDLEMQKQQGPGLRQRAQEGKRREMERQELEQGQETPRRNCEANKIQHEVPASKQRQSTTVHALQQGEQREKGRQGLDQQPKHSKRNSEPIMLQQKVPASDQKPRRSSSEGSNYRPEMPDSERRQSTTTHTSQQVARPKNGRQALDQEPKKPRRNSEPNTLQKKVSASEQRRSTMSHAPQQTRPATRAERIAEKRRRSLELGIDACDSGSMGISKGGLEDHSGVRTQGEVEIYMSSMDVSPVQVDMLNPPRDDRGVPAQNVQTRRPKQKERRRDCEEPHYSRASYSRSRDHASKGGKRGATTMKPERSQADRSRSQKSTGGVPMQVEVEMCKKNIDESPIQVDAKRSKRDDRRVPAQQVQARRHKQHDRRKDSKEEHFSSRGSSSRSVEHAARGGKDNPAIGNTKRMSAQRSKSERSRTETGAGGMPTQVESEEGWDESPSRTNPRRPKPPQDDRRSPAQQVHTRRPKQKGGQRDSNGESFASSRSSSSRDCESGNGKNTRQPRQKGEQKDSNEEPFVSSRQHSSRDCRSGDGKNVSRHRSEGRKVLDADFCHQGEVSRPSRPISSAASAPQRRRRTTSAAQQMTTDRNDVASMPRRRRHKGNESLAMDYEGDVWNAPPPTTIG